MSQSSGFNLQRARGTGKECLTEEERAAKDRIEARFANCHSFAEVWQTLEKMAEAQRTAENEQEGKEVEQEPSLKDFMRQMGTSMQTLTSAVQNLQAWKDDQELKREEHQGKLTKEKQPEDNYEGTSMQFKIGKWNEGGLGDPRPFKPETQSANCHDDELDYYALYATSEEEDEKLVYDDPGRLHERMRRRKKRKAAREQLENKKRPRNNSREDGLHKEVCEAKKILFVPKLLLQKSPMTTLCNTSSTAQKLHGYETQSIGDLHRSQDTGTSSSPTQENHLSSNTMQQARSLTNGSRIGGSTSAQFQEESIHWQCTHS